jgi:DNA-nicking Smr family endonuclease
VKEPQAMLPHHGRPLSPEEIDLWLQAMRTVQPRHPRPNSGRFRPSLSQPPTSRQMSEAIAGKPPAIAKPWVPPLVPLERRLRQRLQRGQIEVHGAVDLHGMRQAQAHRTLQSFLRQAQANGARVVLVITGKGSSGRAGATIEAEGVLRRSVPLWLQAAELRSVVIGFEQAGIAHGGAGALYVRIRRAGTAGSTVR